MSKKIIANLQDKYAYIPLFSKLLTEPDEILRSTSGYKLTPEDFYEPFHQVLFVTITDLHADGFNKIGKFEINSYLKDNFTQQYATYKEEGGDEYIDRALKIDKDEDNFDYYYNRVKKFSLLRHYTSVGISVSDIYDTEEDEPSLLTDMNTLFNKMTILDIVKHIDNKIIDIKTEFIVDKDGNGGKLSDNIREIFRKKKLAPSFGSNFLSGFFNTATRGARTRKFYCISGNSGSGKTRSMIGNLVGMCATEVYNPDTKKWEKTNNKDKGLFISTELEEDEIKIPAVCFIACVDEDSVHNNILTEEEEARLEYAFEVLENSPLWFEEMFDFDDNDLENEIERYVVKYGVNKIMFDYLHSTLKMFDSMAKKGARNLQEHQVLRIMSIRLKNMCNKYNVFIQTSTQLNDAWKQGVLDHGALEGSKSIVNKLDLGAIQIGLTEQDEALYDEIKRNANLGFHVPPTHTINIYKNRGNRWKMIRIWVHFDLGTLRMTDVFVTNYKGELIANITPTFIENFLNDEEEEEQAVVFSQEEEDHEIKLAIEEEDFTMEELLGI